MKIIINPQLRKLRTYLNQKHIKYQDFMLNKTILKFSFSQQTYLISCLQNLDITKEQFSFLLNVFENSNTLFYKILDLIRKGVIFGPKEVELYYENKEIYEILVNIKQKNSNIDCLSQTFIDTWGKDVICKNYNIMPLYNLYELKKYNDIYYGSYISLYCDLFSELMGLIYFFDGFNSYEEYIKTDYKERAKEGNNIILQRVLNDIKRVEIIY